MIYKSKNAKIDFFDHIRWKPPLIRRTKATFSMLKVLYYMLIQNILNGVGDVSEGSLQTNDSALLWLSHCNVSAFSWLTTCRRWVFLSDSSFFIAFQIYPTRGVDGTLEKRFGCLKPHLLRLFSIDGIVRHHWTSNCLARSLNSWD